MTRFPIIRMQRRCVAGKVDAAPRTDRSVAGPTAATFAATRLPPPQERGRSASGSTGSRIGRSSCGSRGGGSTGSLYGCGSFTGGCCGSAGCGRGGMTGSLGMQGNVGRND